MAVEYIETDRQRLYLVAELQQQFWTGCDSGVATHKLNALASEIRQQEVQFGLTPADRRRLQWQIQRGDRAAERTAHRRTRANAKPTKDPRGVLRVVRD
jgi:hypothetical protein